MVMNNFRECGQLFAKEKIFQEAYVINGEVWLSHFPHSLNLYLLSSDQLKSALSMLSMVKSDFLTFLIL